MVTRSPPSLGFVKFLIKVYKKIKTILLMIFFCGVSVLNYFNINFYMLTTNIYFFSFCKCVHIHKVYTINMLPGVCTYSYMYVHVWRGIDLKSIVSLCIIYISIHFSWCKNDPGNIQIFKHLKSFHFRRNLNPGI